VKIMVSDGNESCKPLATSFKAYEKKSQQLIHI